MVEDEGKKVFVSGCFDLFHAGHAKFLSEAASYGEVYVAVGSDDNVFLLKNVRPTFSQNERCFICESVKGVKKAFVPTGKGMIDFEPELKEIKPHFFVVNEDGHISEKEEICRELGIEYIILRRVPKEGLPERSSTEIRELK